MNIEDIKFICLEYDLQMVDALELVKEFDQPDAAIKFWTENLTEEKLQKMAAFKSQKARHYKAYGHRFYFLDEEECGKVTSLTKEHCNTLWANFEWKEYFARNNNPKSRFYLKAVRSFSMKSYVKEIERLTNWTSEDEIYFFETKDKGVRTTWKIFCKYWLDNQYEGEYNVVMSSKDDTILVSIESDAYIGTRK